MKKLLLLSFTVITGFIGLYGQVIIDKAIVGKNAKERFGAGWNSLAVSSDGNIIAAASQDFDKEQGIVRVYQLQNGQWKQLGKGIKGGSKGEHSGYSIDLSFNGKRIAIGSPCNSVKGTKAGVTRVFEWNGNNWKQLGQNLFGPKEQSRSGVSVALSNDGNTLLVPYRAYSPSNKIRTAGLVKVFIWDPLKNLWKQKGKDIVGQNSMDRLGAGADISGDGNRIVVGAYLESADSNANDKKGVVRVFEWDNNQWKQKGNTITGLQNGDQLGYTVRISADGSTIICGGYSSNRSGKNSGIALVFKWENNQWKQSGSVLQGQKGDHLGQSLAINGSGTRIAIGAHLNDAGGKDAGQVRIYEYDQKAWVKVFNDLNGNKKDHAGPCALSDDGATLIQGFANYGGDKKKQGKVVAYDLGSNPLKKKFYINGRGCVACELAKPGETGNINGTTYLAVDRGMLDSIRNRHEDLTKLCITQITDLSRLFHFHDYDSASTFNQDIGRWDVSNVTNLGSMFNGNTSFNQDLHRWDVSQVVDMHGVFHKATNFNGDISTWNTSKVETMQSLFAHTKAFNGDISQWDVGRVTNMHLMFDRAPEFNQDLGDWDVSSVTDFSLMFFRTTNFNHDLSRWNVEAAENMLYMFGGAKKFDQNLSKWCVDFNGEAPPGFYESTKMVEQDLPDWNCK